MFYFKRLFLFVAIVFAVNTATAQVYEVEPDVANCKAGKLSQATKDSVIKLINNIRARHKIGPVTWNTAKEIYPQAAALSIAASAVFGHDPAPGKKCTTPDSDLGRDCSNLYQGWGTKGYINVTYDKAIIGWLIDKDNFPPENVGHRRLVINPYLHSTALGLINKAPHPTNSGQDIGTAGLWGIKDESSKGVAICENDFVAYPYENYPPAWVDKSFYLSFHPLPTLNTWNTVGATNVANAQIVVKNENGTNMNVHSKAPDDGEAWGSLYHSLAFKVDGLKDSVRYEVTISNVMVNNQPRTYTYWFKLTNEPPIPPNPLADVPKLVAPANNTANVEAPVTFKWNKSENAVKYRFHCSRSSAFSIGAIDTIVDNVTDTTLTLTNALLFGSYVECFWRVAAYNVDDVESEYSAVWSFKTKEVIPAPPVPVFPLANMENIARKDDYIWNAVTGAYDYNLQISTSSNFATLAVDKKEIFDTIYHLSEAQMLDEFTTYYWRVKAILLSGSETNWSNSIQYKTDDRPDGIIEELAGVIINCYPNPFSEYISITLDSDKENKVNVAIYNVLGMKVADLYDGVIDGVRTFKFKPTFSNSETYYCKVQIGSASKLIPLTFAKE